MTNHPGSAPLRFMVVGLGVGAVLCALLAVLAAAQSSWTLAGLLGGLVVVDLAVVGSLIWLGRRPRHRS